MLCEHKSYRLCLHKYAVRNRPNFSCDSFFPGFFMHCFFLFFFKSFECMYGEDGHAIGRIYVGDADMGMRWQYYQHAGTWETLEVYRCGDIQLVINICGFMGIWGGVMVCVHVYPGQTWKTIAEDYICYRSFPSTHHQCNDINMFPI